MSIFPREIIQSILSRLPVKSLMRFRCVSKSWLKLIDGPDFIKTHLEQAHLSNDVKIMLKTNDCMYSIDIVIGNLVVDLQRPYETLFWETEEILGSCNGLLLVLLHDVYMFLWNPSTREYKILPESPGLFEGSNLYISYGLGYDPITHDYKVVEVHSRDNDSDDEYGDDDTRKADAIVYSLALDSWKIIPDLPYEFTDVTGKLVNGAIHWEGSPSDAMDMSFFIISFDIGNEEFREVPLPEFKNGKEWARMAVLDGHLCILRYRALGLEVWVMKNYGVRESWTMFFSIGQPVYIPRKELISPLCILKNGEILVNKQGKCLMLYNPKDGRVRNICIRGLSKWNEMEIYVESLVTLKTEESHEGNGRIEEDNVVRMRDEVLSQQDSSSQEPPIDEDQIMYETTGGHDQKGQVCGFGSQASISYYGNSGAGSPQRPLYRAEDAQALPVEYEELQGQLVRQMQHDMQEERERQQKEMQDMVARHQRDLEGLRKEMQDRFTRLEELVREGLGDIRSTSSPTPHHDYGQP
ncbi:hypothetical protein Sjap_011009 [Stephania japonica]|uniref:F-box domain-containing protein n=1 Tax=Stephania japonica TaxID=461633 RepID=A0AAP0P4A7_9MAGN